MMKELLPDALWARITPLLPPEPPKPKGGRPREMMSADHRRLPFTISGDKNAAYPEAFTTSQVEKVLPHDCKLRRVKYLNNIIEQDHRFIEKRVRACLGYRSFDTAGRTLQGV